MPKLRRDSGFERQTVKDNSERRNWEDMAALNTVTRKGWWLWTLNWKEIVALNVQIEKRWWFWTSKLRRDSGSEHQTVNDDSERHNWEDMVPLNAVTKKGWWLWTLNWKEMVALNAQIEKRWWLWTPKLRKDDSSEL